MKHKALFIILLLVVTALSAQIEDILPARPAPVILAAVSPEMRQPGYWIARHPDPDQVIMSPLQISLFNAGIRRKYGTVTAIEDHSAGISGRTIRNQIVSIHDSMRNRRLYNSAEERVSSSYWNALRDLENRAAVPSNIRVRFALASSYTDQRLAPTDDNLNSSPGDFYFDELQNSGYDIGTPFVLYHNASGDEWAFGATNRTGGWIKLQNMAIISRQDWQNYQKAERFVVITAAKSDVWADSLGTDYRGMVRMGTKFPLLGEYEGYYRVLFPYRDEDGSGSLRSAYILKNEAHEGYLPYTPRNAYQQAFKMLGHSYGWGDMNGDWDCSSMILHIFKCFGIELPRNGATQAQAGKVVQEFSSSTSADDRRQAISSQAIGGITMLQMRGHIMLYLGEVDGVHYAFHNTSGYRSPAEEADRNHVFSIKETVVSDLELGAGSRYGSLLMRLVKLSLISQ